MEKCESPWLVADRKDFNLHGFTPDESQGHHMIHGRISQAIGIESGHVNARESGTPSSGDVTDPPDPHPATRIPAARPIKMKAVILFIRHLPFCDPISSGNLIGNGIPMGTSKSCTPAFPFFASSISSVDLLPSLAGAEGGSHPRPSTGSPPAWLPIPAASLPSSSAWMVHHSYYGTFGIMLPGFHHGNQKAHDSGGQLSVPPWPRSLDVADD